MNSVTIDAQVSPDRQLIYTLPPDVPIGRVKLVIQAIDESDSQLLTRKEVRQRLLAAGKLSTTPVAPSDAVALTDEELDSLSPIRWWPANNIGYYQPGTRPKIRALAKTLTFVCADNDLVNAAAGEKFLTENPLAHP